MSGKMNWSRARYHGLARVEANPKDDDGTVAIRCRKCGHTGMVRRWLAETKRLSCSRCGWRGVNPKTGA